MALRAVSVYLDPVVDAALVIFDPCGHQHWVYDDEVMEWTHSFAARRLLYEIHCNHCWECIWQLPSPVE